MFDRILDQYRRYYWAANGLLLLAIAYVLAGMVVRSAIDRFVPMPEPKAAAPVVVKNDRPATIADYQVILSRNLLNAKVEEAPPPPPPGSENGQAAKSTIQATLMGTVAGPARYAFAIVQSGGKTEVVRIHDKIANQAEVLAIRRGVITIMNNGRKEELTMYEEKPLPGNVAPPAQPPEANTLAMADPSNPGGVPDVGVVEDAPHQYSIDKSEFEAMTTNLGPLLTQARVVPNFQNGVINGYKIFAIKPESLYMKIGMENGDIIHSINGIKIDSPEKALQLFQSLRTERTFNIDLSRNNEPMTFNYNLR